MQKDNKTIYATIPYAVLWNNHFFQLASTNRDILAVQEKKLEEEVNERRKILIEKQKKENLKRDIIFSCNLGKQLPINTPEISFENEATETKLEL